MKVVLLQSQLMKMGGLEKSALKIGRAFLEQGNEVVLLTTRAPASLPFLTVSMPCFSWPPSLRLEQFDQKVAKWLNNHPVDIVFGTDRNRFQTHLRAGNGVHAAWLQTRRLLEGEWKYRCCYINPLHRKILELEKKGFEHPGLKRLFVNSEMVKQEVLKYYRVDERKIFVIHNSVEWRQWETSFNAWEKGRMEALQKWKLPSDVLHLLFVGHGYQRKGLDLLLQAMALWNNQHVHLSVIGKERRMAYYQKQRERLGLQKRVHFLGAQSNVLPFYQMADCLVVPSFYDPFANVTVEALAMGLFVISSRYNGGYEILKQGMGLRFDDLQDSHALLACLQQVSPKTKHSALYIRTQVSHLDDSQQLQRLLHLC